jgi:dTDP-4-amino-4,6-dideoxy-D-galactose acyltransferase
MQYTILDFDTKLFGFKVAKILPLRLATTALGELLNQLRAQNVRLVYWQNNSADSTSQLAARAMHGFLGSTQITYAMNLNDLPAAVSAAQTEDIKGIAVYQLSSATIELENLAILAGSYSHFRLDPQFPHELFLKLYRAWINNSVNGSIADVVLVAQCDNRIAGMITVSKKKGRGDIGLLAVDASYRGQNIGTNLVKAAQLYWLQHHLTQAQVVTQKDNLPACRLYEKCGFKNESSENFYHFWL